MTTSLKSSLFFPLDRQYLATEEDGQTGTCRAFKECPPRHVFWPQDDTCYQYHTRGPCLKGYLIYINPISGTFLTCSHYLSHF